MAPKSSGVPVYAVDAEQRHTLVAQGVRTRADAEKFVRMAGFIRRDGPVDLGPSPWDPAGAVAFHVYVEPMRPLTLEERLGLSPTVARGSAAPGHPKREKATQYKLIASAFDDPRQVNMDALADAQHAAASERARRAHR